MERKYVIVCNEHESWPSCALLFWGHRTEDAEARSFGGYTSRFDKCEHYTRDEINRWRRGAVQHYPFFDEIKPSCPHDFRKYNEVVCTLEELESIGFTVWTVICER